MSDTWERWTPEERRRAQQQKYQWTLLVQALWDDDLNARLYDPRRVLPSYEIARDEGDDLE